MNLKVSGWDAQHLLEEVMLEDSLASVAYKATVRLVVTPELPKLDAGQYAAVEHEGQTLLDGIIWTATRSEQGQPRVEVVVFDRMIYLDRSEDEYLWPSGQTATSRIRQYVQPWGITLGPLADTRVKLGKAVYRAQTIFSMIQSDLRETARQGGGLYRVRMRGQQMELVELGSGPVLALENVMETEMSRSLEGAVTQVKVLGAAIEDVRSPVLAIVTGQTKELGTLQKVLQDSQIDTVGAAREAGKALLAGIDGTVRVTTIDVPTVRAGDRVTYSGASYIVCNVTHRYQPGTPGEMTLELGSEEYVRRRYYA
ncbi:MAG: phage portal protein [Limnochordales bacterium]|nr:phage portal protein [Limnochordales bacterium]